MSGFIYSLFRGVSKKQVDNFITSAVVSSGTFTPVLLDNSEDDSEGQTYNEQSGIYRLVDDICFFALDITVTSLGTLTTTDRARIGGLPFTVQSANGSIFTANVAVGRNLSITAGVKVTGLLEPAKTNILLQKWDATTGDSNMLISEFTASGRISASGFYVTA